MLGKYARGLRREASPFSIDETLVFHKNDMLGHFVGVASGHFRAYNKLGKNLGDYMTQEGAIFSIVASRESIYF